MKKIFIAWFGVQSPNQEMKVQWPLQAETELSRYGMLRKESA
jgi:hypothetical protein